MVRKAAAGDDYYRKSGLKTKKSDRREETEAGKLAAYIIDKIPEGYGVYEDNDINEVHIADAIVETCGRYIRHCPQIGWMVYRADDGCWTEEYAEAAVQKVITHFGELLFEEAQETNPGEKAFARRILSSAGIGAVKNILKNNVKITVLEEAFDAEGDVVNCKGDLYNMREGVMRKAEPEDLLSKSTASKAAELLKGKDGHWKMPELPKMFEKFINKVTSKDGKMRADLAFYILFYFGYSLTGDNGASFFVNFHGQGKNGKSVLLNLMLKIFGDYAVPLPQDIVIENRFQGQFDFAGLPGKRLGVLIDAPEGRLNMDGLKSIISGDTISAKRKYLKDTNFNPVCKIAVGSNPKLTLKDTGMAIRRRIRMVPFDYIVKDEEMISDLCKQMLKAEAPQILALLIWFAHEYYKNGEGPAAFPSCAVVDQASAEYMESEDLVGRWKKERTEIAAGGIESSDDLYKDFLKWCDDEGVRKKMSKNKFGDHLTILNPDKTRKESKYYYCGLVLKNKLSSGSG